MASAKFLEEALSTDVDESAVNAIVGCLENQLGTSTPSATPQQGSPQEVTHNHMNSAISNGGAVSTQKHGVSPVDSMNNVLLNDGNKTNASTMATTQTSTIGQINTVLGSVSGTVISRSNYVNQVSTSLGLTQTSLANLSKGQEPVRILCPNQNINNRVTFPAPSVTTLQNGNLGLASLPLVNPGTTVSQNPLLTSTNVSKPVGNIGVINSQDQTKSSSPMLVIKPSGAPLTTPTVSVPSGVMSVPLSVNSSIPMAGTSLNSVVTGSSSSNVTGVVTVSKALASTVSTTTTNMLPGNLVLNVNTVRPSTPGAAGQKAVGPRLLIGTSPIMANRQATPSISLQALQAIQSGVQGTIFLKTENGYQLLRVGPPTAVTPTTMTQSTTTSVAGATTASQPAFRLQTVPAVSSNNGTNTVKVPVYLGTVPVATTAATSVQTSTSVQTTSVSNVPALATPTIAAVQPQVRQTSLETAKEKCRKFLANLLDLSTREPKTVERNVRSLIQELVDSKVEPDEFCTRLERLLNASPQPCLIAFLKKSLPLLRQSMISNEFVIDGIRPPLAPAGARPQPMTVILTPTTSTATVTGVTGVTGVPQIQWVSSMRPSRMGAFTPSSASVRTVARGGFRNQLRPAGVTTQTVRVVTPFSTATTAAAGTVVGGMQTPRPTLQMHHRLVSVPMTTSGAPGLVSVSTVTSVTTPVVSTPSPAQSPMPSTTAMTGVVNAPPLHRPTGPQTLTMQTRTLMPIKQPVGVPVGVPMGVRPQMVQIRAQAPLIRTTTPVRVTTPVTKTTAIQSKLNTHTKVTSIQKPLGKTEQMVPTLASVRMSVPSLAVASSVASSSASTLVSAGTPSVLPSLASSALTPSSTPTSTVLVVSSASQTVSTSSIVSTPTLVTATSVPTTPQVIKAVAKEKKTFSSAGYTGDDDINDVAAMGGVNLAEETQRILGSTEFVGTTIRSCKDDIFLHAIPLQQRIKKIVAEHGLDEPLGDVAALISHATQEKLKNLVEKLDVIAEHRLEQIKMDQRYEVAQDVKGQLKFLEELDKMERKRHDEQERELLLRAAKSRSKTEDPEQAKLKAKAREMQRAEMEEVRQREANLTALQAIGVRKKPRLEGPNPNGESASQAGGLGSGNGSGSLNRMAPPRPRLKRVNLRDVVFLLEQEKDTKRSAFLYKAYLK